MADNYLEKRMEEYRAGKLSRPHSRPVHAKRPSDYEGMSVYITNGASHTGQAIIKAFRDKGCRVAFCDSNRRLGPSVAQSTGAQYHPLDPTNPVTLNRSLDMVIERWGSIDTIIFTEPVSISADTLQSLVGKAHTKRIIYLNPSDQKVAITLSENLKSTATTVNSIHFSSSTDIAADVAHVCLLLAHPASGCLNALCLPIR